MENGGFATRGKRPLSFATRQSASSTGFLPGGKFKDDGMNFYFNILGSHCFNRVIS